MNLRKFLFLSFLCLSLAALVQAQIVPLSGGGRGIFPTIAVNQQGYLLVIWTGDEPWSHELFYRVQKPGQTNWTAIKSLNFRRESAEFPKLRVDSTGLFHLVFHEGTSSMSREVYYATYDATQDKWSGKIRVTSNSVNDAWPAMDIEGDKVYLAWYHEHGEPWAADVMVTFKQFSATRWDEGWDDASLDAETVSIHPHFKVRNGNVYIAWMELLGGGWRLYYNERINGKWGEPRDIGGDHFPDMETDDFAKAGAPQNIHILHWGSDRVFYTSRIDGVWSQENINNTRPPTGFCDIELKDKTLIAAFTQKSIDEVTPSIFLRKRTYNNGWGAWGPLIEMNDSEYQGNDPTYPDIALDNHGYCHVVWVDNVRGEDETFYAKVKMFEVAPAIALDKTSLEFTAKESGANPASQTFKVKNGGDETLSYAITTNKTWLTVSPASGTSTGEWDDITVSANITDIEEGTQTAEIQIADPKATNSPQKIAVTLTISAPDLFAPQNFAVLKTDNKALFYRERIHKLTWQANANNKKITKYRIQEVSGGTATQLVEIDANILTYTRRNVSRTKSYTYRVLAVDYKGRVSPYAEAVAN